MFFIDRNRQRVVNYAQQILNQTNETGESPTVLLEKLASEYQLNPNWKQRVVEEYNILSFLDKLKEGTHHENFQLMEPIVDEAEQWVDVPFNEPIPLKQNDSSIEKAASYENANVIVTPDMFAYGNEEYSPFEEIHLVADQFDDTEELEKVAFYQKKLHEDIRNEELIKEASYKIENERYKIVNELTKIANISPGVAKAVIRDLVKIAGDDETAEDVMVACKYNTQEIINSDFMQDVTRYELQKVAKVSELIEELKLLIPVKKEISKVGEKSLEIAKYFKNNPEKSIIALLAAKQPYSFFEGKETGKVATNIAAFANS